MRVIRDPDRLREALNKEHIPDLFETENLDFELLSFSKGELIASPMKPLRTLLFLLSGSVAAYDLREDGTSCSISQGVSRGPLGALELVRADLPAFYTEAMEDVLCVALPFAEKRALLLQDRKFTQYLLQNLTEVILTFTLIGRAGQPTEEKVLTFLRLIQPDHTLHSIQGSLMQFHCSRRHLQRVVKKLCCEGKLEKIGKGKYRLSRELR